MDSRTAASAELGVTIWEWEVSIGAGKGTKRSESASHTLMGSVSFSMPQPGRWIPPEKKATHQPWTMARRSSSPIGRPPGSGLARRNCQKLARAPEEPVAWCHAVETDLSSPE